MQTETTILPVVQLNVHRTVNRNPKLDSKNSTLESKKLSSCKKTLFQSNKKCLNPLLGAPYRGSIKQQSLSDEPKSGDKSVLGQRVMSAKMLRFKQLQNQLADAHYHLNELANENRLLKALQKRQDSALRRYEGTNAELPRLINSHHEELRILQTKYKKLKELHKDTCNMLKEKENELYSANSQNKHLLQLSKDRNLEEREKLQLQLSDMNHKVQQQQETIQLLHRKLALESKSLKHQLHVEISKHKETQKNLQEKIEKLKSLEYLLDNREKRLYYNGQLPIYNKEKNLGSHSLTNLSIPSNPVKISNRNKKSETDISKDNLPLLDPLESNEDEKIIQMTNNTNHSVDRLKSETMASLQQIRKFRLQRSPHMRKNAHSMDDLRFRSKDPEMRRHNEKITTDYKERNDSNNDKNESGKLRKLFSKVKNQNLQKELNIEFDHSSDDEENDSINEYHMKSYVTDTSQKSRELYARLISSTDDISDTLDDMMKKVDIHYSDEEEKELNASVANDLMFQKHKSKLRVLQHYRNKDVYDSDSEFESDEKIDTNGDSSIEYKTNNFQTDLSKYTKFNKSFNDIAHLEHNGLEMREQSAIERLKDVQLQKMSDHILDNLHTENREVSQQSLKKIWPKGQQFLEEAEIENSFNDIKKEDYIKGKNEIYLEDKCEEMKNLPSPKRREVKKSSQEEESTANFDESNCPAHNLQLEEEYLKPRIEETPSVIHQSNEETLNENNFNVKTKNKLNTSLEAENTNTLSTNVQSHQTEQTISTKAERIDNKQINDKKKVINYDKEKLLATMKAIDDNENIEYLNQGFKNHNTTRMQITENLYRGLPTHSKPKRDIIKNIFEDNHIEHKVRGTCSKSH
ncbi:centrosomal protein of 128 kDa isoform X2 [Cataglyphis hispanica]|uniref:centrosomal protein of 128 kDa isoform X2 n=1 Tax=Cataglyphis hispanica TaxID=1086592 RepID=UPI0021806FE2|nr:centrosomal protein of 128 kDa isoform X2 [Cataglyphis hispanica]